MTNNVLSFYSKSFGRRPFTTIYDSSKTMAIWPGEGLAVIEQVEIV